MPKKKVNERALVSSPTHRSPLARVSFARIAALATLAMLAPTKPHIDVPNGNVGDMDADSDADADVVRQPTDTAPRSVPTN